MENESSILEIVHWWEKRRGIYNLSLLIPILFHGIIASDTFTHLGGVVVLVLIWIFGANVFYTMSWALEILIFKYFGKFILNNKVRITIFCLGTIFSMIWTYLGI